MNLRERMDRLERGTSGSEPIIVSTGVPALCGYHCVEAGGMTECITDGAVAAAVSRLIVRLGFTPKIIVEG